MANELPLVDVTKLINEDVKEIKGAKGIRRVEILDEFRGLCVLLLIIYHICYLLFTYFEKDWAGDVFDSLEMAKPVVAALFIMISGISIRLSRDPIKHALVLLTCALVISLVTLVLFPELGIKQAGVWFGVLHMLSCSAFLFVLGKKLFDKFPALVGALVSLALFCWFAPVERGEFSFFGSLTVALPDALYESNLLFPFGFHNAGFKSWDYLPLLPYFFMYLFGSFIGVWFVKGHLPEFCYKPHIAILGRIGRKALILFLLHIPIFYGIAYLVHLFTYPPNA